MSKLEQDWAAMSLKEGEAISYSKACSFVMMDRSRPINPVLSNPLRSVIPKLLRYIVRSGSFGVDSTAVDERYNSPGITVWGRFDRQLLHYDCPIKVIN